MDGPLGTDGGACPQGGCAATSCAQSDGGPLLCNGESCCTSPLVTGGSFYRGYDGVNYTNKANPATLSDFRLDKYEITVGRFRKFVDAYPGNRPASGQGKNPNNPQDRGWDSAWNAGMPADKAALIKMVKCDSDYQTWTDSPGANEAKPVNCISWIEAFAFCIWDGGRLPTEAEWNYAAAGGDEQRVYPWGSTAPSTNTDLAVYGCYYGAAGKCTGTENIAPVGAAPGGNGKWTHADLAGSVWEWVLAYFDAYPNPCTDCVSPPPGGDGPRINRGGSFNFPASGLPSAYRGHFFSSGHAYNTGARCARTP